MKNVSFWIRAGQLKLDRIFIPCYHPAQRSNDTDFFGRRLQNGKRRCFVATSTTEVVVRDLCSMVGSRRAAADALRKVADAGGHGGFPDDVTCEQIGQALERICLNAPVRNPLTRVLRGWRKATRRRDRAHADVVGR